MTSNLQKSVVSDAPKFLRLPQVLERIPVCPSVWWLGIKKGIYPAGIKLSANTTAWHSADIDELIERLWKQGGAA
jgi:prophage regulatory protein